MDLVRERSDISRTVSRGNARHAHNSRTVPDCAYRDVSCNAGWSMELLTVAGSAIPWCRLYLVLQKLMSKTLTSAVVGRRRYIYTYEWLGSVVDDAAQLNFIYRINCSLAHVRHP